MSSCTPLNTNIPITLEAVQGLWIRQYLTAGELRDTTTHVAWMQANNTHIDLRLSATCQDLPAAALCNQQSNALMEIASIAAFAGTTHISESVCTWTRHINYQGPQATPDVGALQWADNLLIESGVHEEYEEAWRHLDAGPVQSGCFKSSIGQLLFICMVSDHFALARAQPADMSSDCGLPGRVGQALAVEDQEQLLQLFDQEFCFGKMENSFGVIHRSSNPARVGYRVFRVKEMLSELRCIDITQQDFLGMNSVHRYYRVE